MTLPLNFGISGLDGLIQPKKDSEQKVRQTNWTTAIVGPDGCGKSILALHLASKYWATHCEPKKWDAEKQQVVNPAHSPRVIYVSTDLSLGQAEEQWRNFGLNYPRHSELALRAAYGCVPRTQLEMAMSDEEKKLYEYGGRHELKLKLLSPAANHRESGSVDELELCLNEDNSRFAERYPSVYFLDLQSQTAGDDWGFINHLVGLLPNRKHQSPSLPNHLLIIDAVEGLETFVGRRDSFGQSRDRRSRVAQLIRNAARIGVHLVFVVEEPHADARLPEQFVTDLVIRVRHPHDGTYTQRSIEIEKCRSFAHARGQHELGIRSGCGAFTGTQAHIDDPRIYWRTEDGLVPAPEADDLCDDETKSLKFKGEFLAHVAITESMHLWNRRVREQQSAVPEVRGHPTFGLDPLDELLKTETRNGGSLTFLFGDAGTNKGRLSRRFLAQAFSFGPDYNLIENESGVSVLLTTRFLDRPAVVSKLAKHLVRPSRSTYKIDPDIEEQAGENARHKIEGRIHSRILCQRLSVRHLSSNRFLEIVSTYIAAAKQILLVDPNTETPTAPRTKHKRTLSEINQLDSSIRRTDAFRIRFVLEDWNVILASHPNLGRDPLLLPSIITLFKREGITAVIVSTQPGQPHLSGNIDSHDLRHMDEPQVFTWNVPFFGERRVAVTALSLPATTRGPLIYELRPQPSARGTLDDEQIEIHKHFALYANVDTGQPTRIPLKVRLYSGNHPLAASQGKEPQFAVGLKDMLSQAFPNTPNSSEVIIYEPFSKYDELFSFSDALDDAQLDHTVVFQADEFWTTDKNRSLADLSKYWKAVVARPILTGDKIEIDEFDWVRDEDSYGMFQPHCTYRGVTGELGIPKITSRSDHPQGKEPFKRWNMFHGPGDGGPLNLDNVRRVSYLWDFGFLLGNYDCWNRHKRLELSGQEMGGDEGTTTVADVWNALCVDENDMIGDKKKAEYVSWEQFCEACKLIGAAENIVSLDVDLSTIESLSCLLLEMWASIERDLHKGIIDPAIHAFNATWRPNVHEDPEQKRKRFTERLTLRKMVAAFPHSLFLAMRLLFTTCTQLHSQHKVISRRHQSPKFAASREWYHTASAVFKGSPQDHLVLLRLPGHYSVRGDWSLAVASGSRSLLLAQRAIDILTSRRMNLLRLQDGIGLPVRDVLLDEEMANLPTALTRIRQEDDRRTTPLLYKEVCQRGADPGSDFHWLWRSLISQYGRDTFYFRRWIASRLEDKHQWLPSTCPPEFIKDLAGDRQATLESLSLGVPIGLEKFHDSERLGQHHDILRGFVEKRGLLLSALRNE